MTYTKDMSRTIGYGYDIQFQLAGGTSGFTTRALAGLPGTRTGVSVPNRRKLIEDNRQAGSDYVLDVYDCTVVEESAVLNYHATGSPSVFVNTSYNGLLRAPEVFAHIASLSSDQESALLSRMYQKIRSNNTRVNGMVILGEMSKTLTMLRHPAASLTKRVSEYFETLSKRKSSVLKISAKKRRDAWSDIVTGTYLEAVFGWAPLLSDIEGLVRALDVLARRDPFRTRISGNAQATSSVVDSHTNTETIQHTFMAGVFSITNDVGTAGTKFVIGLDLQEECANTSLNGMLTLFGFKPQDFVPTIYELMPWSWVIDYFTNLGSLLSAGTTDVSSVRWIVKDVMQRTVRVVKHVRVSEDVQRNILQANGYTLDKYSGGYGSHQTVRTSLTRTLPTALPMPDFVVTHPGHNIKQMLNLLAVAEQLRISSRDLSWLHSIVRR